MKNEEEDISSPEDLVETLVPGLSRDEYENIRLEAHEKAKTTRHAWIMKGRGRLTCTSCEIPHATHIPLNKILKGINDDGSPNLQNG